MIMLILYIIAFANTPILASFLLLIHLLAEL